MLGQLDPLPTAEQLHQDQNAFVRRLPGKKHQLAAERSSKDTQAIAGLAWNASEVS